MSKFIDLTGMTFNRLKVVNRSKNDKRNNATWSCICECGNTLIVRTYSLKSGNTKSCGCLKQELLTGKSNPMKNKENQNKLSKTKTGLKCPKGSLAKIGENNPMWKKELTQQERNRNKSRLTEIKGYKDFKIKVAMRDKNTCQCCGYKSGKNMRVHHLNSFKNDVENRINPNNAVILCNKCHDINFAGSFHNIYGRNNNTREQFIEFIKNKTNTKPSTSAIK